MCLSLQVSLLVIRTDLSNREKVSDWTESFPIDGRSNSEVGSVGKGVRMCSDRAFQCVKG